MNEERRPNDITHTRHPEQEGRDDFRGGENLRDREEFAGRENVVRERREHAADPGEPLQEETGDR